MDQIKLVNGINLLEATLRNYAYRLTREKNAAMDLFQETAYRAFKNMHQFRKDSNLRSWLMTIMYNAFVNDYRKKKRMVNQIDPQEKDYLLENCSLSVQNLGELRIDYEEINRLVQDLDAPLRKSFLMSYEGYSYKEISAELEIPVGTVKSRIFQARRKLQRAIRKRSEYLSNHSLNAA